MLEGNEMNAENGSSVLMVWSEFMFVLYSNSLQHLNAQSSFSHCVTVKAGENIFVFVVWTNSEAML